MINGEPQKISMLKKMVDKFLRVTFGSYEENKQIEINKIQKIYEKLFGKIPEILNLGENYDNRIELSTASFKLDYWIDQLNGNFFHDTERMIDIICSYETEKRQRFIKGYTDDPVHLLFYDLKQYIIKLSQTQFDIEDVKDAQRWQNLLRELIINQVFEPSHEDTRVQVLFDLEATLRKAVIPKLVSGNENKSALDHLKSVSAHLTKFSDITFKYLFYIGRDSEYLPNFSIRKMRTIKNDKEATTQETLGITASEYKILNKIKNTWPIELLYQIFAKDEKKVQQEQLSLMSSSQPIEKYLKDFTIVTFDEKRIKNLLQPYYVKDSKKSDFFAKHINLQYFINAHLLLQELGKFKELFDIAKACAEMGGNLLTFGLLREQLVQDVQDCSKYLYAINTACEELEECAWEALRQQAGNDIQISKHWRDNYNKSAANYFNSLKKSYELCQEALGHLASAATRKSKKELLEETERVTKRYLMIHTQHLNYRKDNLSRLDHLSSFNSFLSQYQHTFNNSNAMNELHKVWTLQGNDPREDYKQFKELVKSDIAKTNYKTIIEGYIKTYNDDNFKSSYYIAKILSYVADSTKQQKEFYNKALAKNPDHIKSIYRLSQLEFKEKNFNVAKDKLKVVIEKCHSIGLTQSNFFKKANDLHLKVIQEIATQETNLSLKK